MVAQPTAQKAWTGSEAEMKNASGWQCSELIVPMQVACHIKQAGRKLGSFWATVGHTGGTSQRDQQNCVDSCALSPASAGERKWSCR